MPEKLLLITQVFYPDQVSTAHLFTSLCAEIAKKGITVKVWCAQPSYTHREKQPNKVWYKGMHIHYLKSTRFHKSFFFGRLLNYLSFSFSVMLKLLYSRDKSPVLTHTTPPSLGILIAFISKLKRRRFIYVQLDIFPEGLIRVRQLSRHHVLILIWQRFYIASLKQATHIVVIGRDMKEHLLQIYPKGKEKLTFIPLWQDPQLIRPKSDTENQIVKQLGLEKYFVVQYSGNMGLWNDMETFAHAVNQRPEGVKFFFIGDGMRKQELIQAIDPSCLENTIFLPFQSADRLGEVLTACNAGLVSLRVQLGGMAVPSKIYGILAAGVPVIALVPQESEIAYILKEEECGIVVSPGNVNGFLRAIKTLQEDEHLRKTMGDNGRVAFEKKYTLEMAATRFINLISENR